MLATTAAACFQARDEGTSQEPPAIRVDRPGYLVGRAGARRRGERVRRAHAGRGTQHAATHPAAETTDAARTIAARTHDAPWRHSLRDDNWNAAIALMLAGVRR
ncbi:MAG TPA: hypothetical protein VNK41_10510 [Vicinamibacterales bacterium]|nr:hypothetical protein [Vicinamibacterales bacterium]